MTKVGMPTAISTPCESKRTTGTVNPKHVPVSFRARIRLLRRSPNRMKTPFVARLSCVLCCGIAMPHLALGANSGAAVSLTIDGAPAKAGDYKPADIKALVLENGLLRITFGKDAVGDFSAT